MAKIYRDAEAKEMMEERNYQARGIEAIDNNPSIESMLVSMATEGQRMAEVISMVHKRLDPVLVPEGNEKALGPVEDFGSNVSTVFRNLNDQLEVMRSNRYKLEDLLSRVNL